MKPKIMAIVFLVALTVACQPQDTDTLYKTGRSFVFKVSVKDSSSLMSTSDTLILTIKDKGMLGSVLGMNMAEWTSTKHPDKKGERGVNLKNNSVEIQTPLNYGYLENENIVIAGYPSFSKSMSVGYTTKSKNHFPKSYGTLAGKELEQYKKVLDSSKVKYSGKFIYCKVAEYKNLNLIDELGEYKLKTFYSKNHGFLRMDYSYPNGKTIKFELIGTKDEG